MEIRQIKYYIKVCNDKSFSKAAENLNISHQALSKAIKNLEDELEISLFDRSSKGVTPTEFGNELLERSQKIVNDFDSMVDFFYEKVKVEKGTITIGLPRSLDVSFFGTLICEFQDAYREIILDIVEVGTYKCEKYLEENSLDICFSFKPDSTEKLDFVPMYSCSMVLLVNKDHSFAQKSAVKFINLKCEKFIMLSPEYKSRHIIIERCLQSGFMPNIVFTTSQIELIYEMVALNKGVAIVPHLNSVIATKISDKVSFISFQDISFNCEFGFLINKYRKINHITNTLIKWLNTKFPGLLYR